MYHESRNDVTVVVHRLMGVRHGALYQKDDDPNPLSLEDASVVRAVDPNDATVRLVCKRTCLLACLLA